MDQPAHRLPARTLWIALPLALALVVAACDSTDTTRDVAQTFTVTVVDTTSAYPYVDRNQIGVAYAIDGEIGREITLERGETYEFRLQNVGPTHPLYVGTTARGGGNDVFDAGVENGFSTGNASVFFTPPSSAPDSLFYQCSQHVYMGGKMTITGSSN
jgi:hypothetical protein